MTFDASLTITTVIAIIALLSPIFTSIINNHYQFKMKQLDIDNAVHRENIKSIIEIFETYCKALSQVVIDDTPRYDILIEYAQSYGKALLYMTNKQADNAISIHKLIYKDSINKARELVDNHILEIKEELNKLHK